MPSSPTGPREEQTAIEDLPMVRNDLPGTSDRGVLLKALPQRTHEVRAINPSQIRQMRLVRQAIHPTLPSAKVLLRALPRCLPPKEVHGLAG